MRRCPLSRNPDLGVTAPVGVVGTRFGQIAVQTGAGSGPEIGFEEIAIDLLEARFWTTSVLPTIHSESLESEWPLPLAAD
jgi:hypothetical protein